MLIPRESVRSKRDQQTDGNIQENQEAYELRQFIVLLQPFNRKNFQNLIFIKSSWYNSTLYINF